MHMQFVSIMNEVLRRASSKHLFSQPIDESTVLSYTVIAISATHNYYNRTKWDDNDTIFIELNGL